MFVRKIYIIFIFFILTFSLKSNELIEYKIVLVDILKDIRYSNWGVHPVDIRSKYKKEKRPIAGAKLAIEDSKMIQRLTKTKFTLDYLRFNDQKDFLVFFKNKKLSGYNAILLDSSKNEINILKEVFKENSKLLFFNITESDNDLRKNICLKNFFHTFPSEAMLTDSIAQYLIKKKWNKVLMLTGPLDEDKILSNSFKQSSKKFGVKIIKEKFFVNSNDPRVRDKNSLAFLTKGKKYNTVFVSDIDGEFALSIPNATMSPALVTGSSGLGAKAWHWSYLRHGAPQLNGRFERLNNRRMESKDWSAWIAIKTLVEAVLRVQSTNNDEIIEYITSNKLNLDGSKGISLSYKKKSNQLRQTILLTTSDNWVTIKAPLDDFQNNNNRLDTLGISPKDITCN
jgi:ABC transporter substrate binding protein (PQQ-dependent alcohol dehydrogenase system)